MALDFTANPLTGVAPLSVSFTDLSTMQGLPGNNIVTRFWQFGDREASWERNPIHLYSSSGNYTVRLRIETDYEDDEGNVFEIIKNSFVNVSPPPPPPSSPASAVAVPPSPSSPASAVAVPPFPIQQNQVIPTNFALKFVDASINRSVPPFPIQQNQVIPTNFALKFVDASINRSVTIEPDQPTIILLNLQKNVITQIR